MASCCRAIFFSQRSTWVHRLQQRGSALGDAFPPVSGAVEYVQCMVDAFGHGALCIRWETQLGEGIYVDGFALPIQQQYGGGKSGQLIQQSAQTRG